MDSLPTAAASKAARRREGVTSSLDAATKGGMTLDAAGDEADINPKPKQQIAVPRIMVSPSTPQSSVASSPASLHKQRGFDNEAFEGDQQENDLNTPSKKVRAPSPLTQPEEASSLRKEGPLSKKAKSSEDVSLRQKVSPSGDGLPLQNPTELKASPDKRLTKTSPLHQSSRSMTSPMTSSMTPPMASPLTSPPQNSSGAGKAPRTPLPDVRHKLQSQLSYPASDCGSAVSNLSAISARHTDMSYVYQIYEEKKGSLRRAGSMRSVNNAHNGDVPSGDNLAPSGDDLEPPDYPWDDPTPYHIAKYKHEDANYELKLKLISYFLHALLLIILIAAVSVGVIGIAEPELLGVATDPNEVIDQKWQTRLGFENSPLGGKYRPRTPATNYILSFYLTDKSPCLAFHKNRADQFWMHQAGSGIEMFIFNDTGKHTRFVLGNEILDPEADFDIFTTNGTVMAARLKDWRTRGTYAYINVVLTPFSADALLPQIPALVNETELRRRHPAPSDAALIAEFFKDGASKCTPRERSGHVPHNRSTHAPRNRA